MTRPTVEVNQTEADGLQRFPLELDGTLDEVLAFPTFSGCRQFVTFDGQFAPWTDETQPRTERPVRFVRRRIGIAPERTRVERYFRAESGRLF